MSNEARLPSCQRCRVKQDIPTWQFVKFDQEIHYLCAECWTLFRRWFNTRAASRPRTSAVA